MLGLSAARAHCRFALPLRLAARRQFVAARRTSAADFPSKGAPAFGFSGPGRPIACAARVWHSTCFSHAKEIIRMFDNIFGIHEQALLLHGQRLGVLATNLANADTPNYKARDIDFSEVLAHTGEQSLPVRVTQAAHIAISEDELPAGELKYRNPYQASLDGNTVEMPVEQAAFSENNVRYQASLTFINLNIAQMQLAIAGQ
jgi:flagellar basal-body rod protein FlgB